MAIRTEKLGGTDWVDGNVLEAVDLNDTFDATITYSQLIGGLNKFIDLENNASDIQIFTSSGTWNKPIGLTYAYIRVWGGGGGGGAAAVAGYASANLSGGGGGGSYSEIFLKLEDLPSTVSVTVGAGGLGTVPGTITNPTNGGVSSFGTYITTGGGGAGINISSNFRAAAGGTPFLEIRSLTPIFGTNNSNNLLTTSGLFSGAGSASNNVKGNSIYGGGGGGSLQIGSGTARINYNNNGTSLYGGNGGVAQPNPSLPGGDGEIPGGGGGAGGGNSGVKAGDGARGQVEVYCF